MQDYRGEMFPTSGISGVPFAGKTGLEECSSHVASSGNIIVTFVPHVAISETTNSEQCAGDGAKIGEAIDGKGISTAA
jgi:hypothetical protein